MVQHLVLLFTWLMIPVREEVAPLFAEKNSAELAILKEEIGSSGYSQAAEFCCSLTKLGGVGCKKEDERGRA